MVHITSTRLTQKQQTALLHQLSTTLGKLNSTQTNTFITSLLGPEEQLMIAKRLAALILFSNGHSIYSVANKLAMSTSTASRFKTKFEHPDQAKLLELLRKDSSLFTDLLHTVDAVLQLGGLLPRYGNAKI